MFNKSRLLRAGGRLLARGRAAVLSVNRNALGTRGSEPCARSGTIEPVFRVRNELELQVFGMRRFGNHAVIAWIAQQYSSPIVFLNNVRPFHDPFKAYLMGPVPNAVPHSRLGPAETERLRAQQKELLLLSYEDVDLRKLGTMELLPDHEQWLGNSKRRKRLLILRDFYSWIASRVRLFENKGESADSVLAKVERQIRLWLVYAREFCGESSYLKILDTVPVRFDRWSGDEFYRLEILMALGIRAVNNTRSIVPRAGGGSSFDGTKFSGNPEEMNVLNRWEYLRASEYRPILNVLAERRAKSDRYNQRIFGLSYPY